MSAMADMSRAIRLTIERHSATGKLTNLPTGTLEEFVQIVGAFSLDLKGELERRRASRPTRVPGFESETLESVAWDKHDIDYPAKRSE